MYRNKTTVLETTDHSLTLINTPRKDILVRPEHLCRTKEPQNRQQEQYFSTLFFTDLNSVFHNNTLQLTRLMRIKRDKKQILQTLRYLTQIRLQ